MINLYLLSACGKTLVWNGHNHHHTYVYAVIWLVVCVFCVSILCWCAWASSIQQFDNRESQSTSLDSSCSLDILGMSQRDASEEERCSSCCKNLGNPRRVHPTLGTYVCRSCYNRLFSHKETDELRCLWCRKPTAEYELAQCGVCPEYVCRSCISRNFGAAYFKYIVQLL